MLTLENLSFEVNDDKGEKGIIKDISLTVGDGKFVVIDDHKFSVAHGEADVFYNSLFPFIVVDFKGEIF